MRPTPLGAKRAKGLRLYVHRRKNGVVTHRALGTSDLRMRTNVHRALPVKGEIGL